MSYRDTIPEHYTGQGELQPWDVWEAFDLDPWEANAVKYIIRAGLKGPALEDYRKAAHYLQYLIEREEAAEAEAQPSPTPLADAVREAQRIISKGGYGR